MQFGLNEAEWELFRSLVVEPLKSFGFRIWIFGSRARKTHHKFSDIDVMLEPTEATAALFGNTAISDVREKIQRSNFPYKVDLVKSAELAESYRPSVMVDRIELK